jgi:hypothetical protein
LHNHAKWGGERVVSLPLKIKRECREHHLLGFDQQSRVAEKKKRKVEKSGRKGKAQLPRLSSLGLVILASELPTRGLSTWVSLDSLAFVIFDSVQISSHGFPAFALLGLLCATATVCR